jgi:ubiquinol-cytochrome c reductase cytochrome c subunit
VRLRIALVGLALVLVGGLFAIGWFSHDGTPDFQAETHLGAESSTPQSVRHIYLRDCATCHGADARGTDLAPTLHDTGTAYVDYVLSTGRMPIENPDDPIQRREPKYSDATVGKLTRYVRDLAGGTGPAIPRLTGAGDVAHGGSIFRLNCAACHAWSGDGGALLERSAPTVHRSSPTEIAEAVRVGPFNMPAFGRSALSDRELESVIRYVRYLDDPHDRGGTALWHLGPLAEGAVAIVIGLGVIVLATRWIGTRT